MVLYFDGYENDTTTNQTITFPIDISDRNYRMLREIIRHGYRF